FLLLLWSAAPAHLHSFPTRRSSDLLARVLPNAVPRWDAAAGAGQLLAGYTRSNLTLAEFEGTRYQRIAHIRQLIYQGVLDADLRDRKSTRLNSSHGKISYAVFCLKK